MVSRSSRQFQRLTRRAVCAWGDQLNLCKYFELLSLRDSSSPYAYAFLLLIALLTFPQCQGTPLVSDVFASALWAVDYVLYVASLQISRLYFHMGTAYRYSPWQPITVNGTAPFAKPLYYGNLLTASALSGGNKQVQVLLNETSLTAYAVFDAGSDGSAVDPAQGTTATQPKLTSMVLLNLNIYNSTFTTPRPYTSFDFTLPTPGNVSVGSSDVKVHRLTAPGVEIASNVTFAGQYVDNSSGVLTGDKVVEEIEDLGDGRGRVRVGDGEALLITF